MIRRANPAALAAARANAERLHRAIGTEAGMPLEAMGLGMGGRAA